MNRLQDLHAEAVGLSKVPLTARGAAQLKEELRRLKTEERPKVTAAIATARAHGDLKENAEYHAAKEQQGLMEARIRDIEAKLSNAQIIDVTAVNAGGKVVFGATVHLVDAADGSEAKYQIVGEDEADIKSGLLSIGSPIARALIGKSEGDEVEVSTPSGKRVLRDHGRRVPLRRTAVDATAHGFEPALAAAPGARHLRRAGQPRGLALAGRLQARADPGQRAAAASRGSVCVDLGAAPGRLEPARRAARRSERAASSPSTCCRWSRFPGVDFLEGDFTAAGDAAGAAGTRRAARPSIL